MIVEAKALAAPNKKGHFLFETNVSVIAIARLLDQEQVNNSRNILRPIAYGSKSFTNSQLNYGAPNLEKYA